MEEEGKKRGLLNGCSKTDEDGWMGWDGMNGWAKEKRGKR